MSLTDNAIQRLSARGLDVELAVRMGLDSEIKRWPVEEDGGRTRFVEVEALLLPFFRAGKLVRRKYKAWERPEGSPPYLQDRGGVRCAFNEDCLRDDTLVGQVLIITEGELDCLAAIQSGFTRAISVPDGAPPPAERDLKELEGSPKYAWLKDIRSYLGADRVKEIILAVDGDENGAALMHDLSLLLGRFRCKYLRYPLAPEAACARLGRERCKDLNEVAQFYGHKGVVETLNRAEYIRVDGVYRMSELPPLPDLPVYVNHRLSRLGSENYRVRMGDFVAMTGVPGLGKTTFATDFYCQISLEHGLKIGWASFEQTPQRDHRRALRSWFGGPPQPLLDPDRYPETAIPDRTGMFVDKMTPAQIREADAWIDNNHVFIVPGEDDDPTVDWMLERMEAAVVQHGVKILIIDPWNEMEHRRDRDETMTEYVGRAIKELKRFARKFLVHLVVIAHPTKSTKDPNTGIYRMPQLYDISDSANWYNKCDLGVIVHRTTKVDTLIKVQKSRYHDIIGAPGEVVMQYSHESRRFTETGSTS